MNTYISHTHTPKPHLTDIHIHTRALSSSLHILGAVGGPAHPPGWESLTFTCTVKIDLHESILFEISLTAVISVPSNSISSVHYRLL